MAHTFDSAFDDPDITVIDRHDSMGSYTVQVGSIPTYVSIELGRFTDSDQTKFLVSHAMKAPGQDAPYQTSIPFADYPEAALHRAIDGLTSWYRMGIAEGHEPSADWLVKN